MYKDKLLKYKIADNIITEGRSKTDIVTDVLHEISAHGYTILKNEEFETLKEDSWMYKSLCD